MMTDEMLIAARDALTPMLDKLIIVRHRGGIARGIAWAELSGRLKDDAWLEVRLHHRPMEHRLQAGALLYASMKNGRRTHVLGEYSGTYQDAPEQVQAEMIRTVQGWVTLLQTTYAIGGE